MGKVIIEWRPDRSLNISLAIQIEEFIKGRINKGDWLIGDVLPSQRQLAVQLGVNRSTIVSALGELTAQGILEATVGSGTVVANNSWSFLVTKEKLNWRRYIDCGFHKANIPTIQAINRFEFDEGIIRLSTGEVSPDLMPQEAFSRVYEAMSRERIPLNYLEPLGLLELREALGRYLESDGIRVGSKEILIVSGSLQGMQLIALALLGRGSKVFVEEYSYAKSLKVFEYSGMQMAPVITDKKGPTPWMMAADSFDAPSSILYTIPTFHNPTGRIMDTPRRRELLDWCRKKQLPILEDEAYKELYFETPPPPSIKSMDDSGNVLSLGTFSKSLAPGIRVGWIIGPEPVIKRLGDIKMQTDYGASSVSQWMMVHLLQSGLYEKHLENLRQQLKSRRDTVLGYLQAYFADIATWNTPGGGFYIWLKLNRVLPTEKFFHQLLEKKVLINPGYIYTFKGSSYIRLSYSYSSMEDMKTGLQTMSAVIRHLQGGKG